LISPLAFYVYFDLLVATILAIVVNEVRDTESWLTWVREGDFLDRQYMANVQLSTYFL
jgi:hypothetical protein